MHLCLFLNCVFGVAGFVFVKCFVCAYVPSSVYCRISGLLVEVRHSSLDFPQTTLTLLIEASVVPHRGKRREEKGRSCGMMFGVPPLEERRPQTVAEAFAETSRALQQFSVERIRVAGLSSDGCGDDGHRTVTEQEFMREFVFHSRPCVIVDALHKWPATRHWRDDRYLFDLDGHLPLVLEKDDKTGEEGDCYDDGGSLLSVSESGTTNKSEVMGNSANSVRELQEIDVEAEHLLAKYGPRRVTVALTPNGRADAVTYVTYRRPDTDGEETEKQTENDPETSGTVMTEKLFMSAAEVRVTLPELYKLLQANPLFPPPRSQFVDLRQRCRPIAYAQMQNNCLSSEYPHLHADIDNALNDFGERVFGGKHEAANIWLGTPASVSSLHQDWVENLYAVVRGVKEFILIPPWEGVFVPKPELPAASFTLKKDRAAFTDGGTSDSACSKKCIPEAIEMGCSDDNGISDEGTEYIFCGAPEKDGTLVPWMDLDLTPAAAEDPVHLKPELRGKLHPLVVYVHPGEVLYLPAIWLHRVAQHADSRDSQAAEDTGSGFTRHCLADDMEGKGVSPLPLIAAVNYWYDMSFTNPAVVMLREFGLLL
ncbi:hypothetical protein TRVL_05078 [Trypanosoma vivax]|uniref:JmjC domain-containing protein n=1 Tax=Trypanosoma vivax (strain Y486) TaxID=1055687 RepID=G0TXK6_TRYVY|nr:hypothetical protein TRVL_05078 [Trypanosoma vivax]CCC48696.1 conserved hypothetical protein [Trypanosoma vivax Y486]